MVVYSSVQYTTSVSLPYILLFTQALTRVWFDVTIISYSIIVVMLGYDWGLRMVINITCLKYQEVVLYFAAFEYPSMTNKEIIQYTSVLFTQAPIRVCLDGTIIDSRTILVTMYYCG